MAVQNLEVPFNFKDLQDGRKREVAACMQVIMQEDEG